MFDIVLALATVKSRDEAVAAAESTGHGLSAAVFTGDLKRD